MGGKGGGGGGGNWQDVWATDPKTGGVYHDENGQLMTKEAYAAREAERNKPEPVISTAIAKPPEPAAPAPAPAAPAPEPTPSPLGPPISAGGGVDQPTGTGDQLGGSVLNPPKYWVGGIETYGDKSKKIKSGTGGTDAMTTSQ